MLTLVAAVVAKFLLPIGFKWIAKQPEIILVCAVAWCFLVVFAGTNIDAVTEATLGVNLHLAVGPGMAALIAGASIASLPYSIEIIGKVGVVRDFFVTLFFVGLGMTIPRPDTADVVLLALILFAAALLIRYLVFFPLLYAAGLDRRNAMVVSTRLAQISEFSLVVGFIGLQLGHITEGLNSAVIFAFVLTALLTPSLFRRADAIHDRLGPLLGALGFRTPTAEQTRGEVEHSLALLGFHRVASSLIHELKQTDPSLLGRTLVVDFNVGIHKKIRAFGPTVKYGDVSNAETLTHAGVDKAKVILCTIPDDLLKGTSNRQIVATVRRVNPTAVIIANAAGLQESQRLYEAGADYVFVPAIETAQAVARAVESALSGQIAAHRAETEAISGPGDGRKEVFD